MSGFYGKIAMYFKRGFTCLGESSFYKELCENKGIIFSAFLLGIVCTLVSYPGIFYSDSYTRAEYARNLIPHIKAIFSGLPSEKPMECWLTLTPSLFMACSKYLCGSFALYTFLQASLFFYLIFALIKRLGAPLRIFQYFLFAASPVIYCASVYIEAGIGTLCGIIAIILILTREVDKNLFDHILDFGFLTFFSFVAFGFRANAFTVLPVIGVYILLKTPRGKKLFYSAAIAIGCAVISLIPKVLDIDTMSSATAGFVWQVITSIQEMDPDTQSEYIGFFDDITEPGSTFVTVLMSDQETVNYLINDTPINYKVMSREGMPGKLLKKYFQFAVSEPASFVSTWTKFAGKTLGVSEKLFLGEYDYDRAGKMSLYGFNDSPRRMDFVNAFYRIHSLLGFYTLRPWIVFLCAALLLIVYHFAKGENISSYIFVFFTAVFYYGAFLINTQSFEIRYFYPALCLLLIISCSITARLLKKFLGFIVQKFTMQENKPENAK